MMPIMMNPSERQLACATVCSSRSQQQLTAESNTPRENLLLHHFEVELQRIWRHHHEEMKKCHAKHRHVQEELSAGARDAEKRRGVTEAEIRKMKQEMTRLKGTKRHLEERLDAALEADRRKAADLRRLHEEQDAELGRLKKEADVAVTRLVREIRTKDYAIAHLKNRLLPAPGADRRGRSGAGQKERDAGVASSASEGDREAGDVCPRWINLSKEKNKKRPSKHKSSLHRGGSDLKRAVHQAEGKNDVSDDRNLQPPKVSVAMYRQLYKEHLNLQRSFSALHQLVVQKTPKNGFEKHIVGWVHEKRKLECIAGYLHVKVEKLQQELQNANERGELLEFCLLELENQTKVGSSQDVVHRGVNTEPWSPPLLESTSSSDLSEGVCSQWPRNGKILEDDDALGYIISVLVSCNRLVYDMEESAGRTRLIEERKEENLRGNQRAQEGVVEYEPFKEQLQQLKKKLIEMSTQLGMLQHPNPGRPWLDQVVALASELQSLMTWTAERQGGDAREIHEKLEQLNRIRKELETSAKKSQQLRSVVTADDPECSEPSLAAEETDLRSQLHEEQEMVSALRSTICHQESYIDQLQSECNELRQTCDHLAHRAAECEGLKSDLSRRIKEVEQSEQDLVEKNLKLYIDYVSAKEQIQKLMLDLEGKQQFSESPVSRRSNQRRAEVDEPDSLGTVISEDEGLGEESRRGDSTGPNSLLDLRATEEEAMIQGSDGEGDSYRGGRGHPTIDTSLCSQLQQCHGAIKNLKGSLLLKEEQLQKILEENGSRQRSSQQQLSAVQNVAEKLKSNIEELNLNLQTVEKERTALREQVLELEEAENDARLEGQRLREKLIFLQEKDNHFQTELAETKQTLEKCVARLNEKEAKERELHSQIRYMEVLIQKYEDQIHIVEASESSLQTKLTEVLQQLKSTQSKSSRREECCDRGTQTYLSKCDRLKTSEEGSMTDSVKSPGGDDESKGYEIEEECTRSVPVSEEKETVINEEGQVRAIRGVLYEAVDEASQTETFRNGDCEECHAQLSRVSCFACREKPEASTRSLVSSSCPFQKELLQRLHHLAEEDAHLQEELHQMDEINLTLWQKLQNLEFHIGECKREDIAFAASGKEANETRKSEETNSGRCLAQPCCAVDSSKSECNNKLGKIVRNQPVIEKIINLDYDEEKLKERLLELERVNLSFEKELEVREKLYLERESRHKKWLETEERFTLELRRLESERSCLSAQVSQLEEEKQQLQAKVKSLESELVLLKEKHLREISQLNEDQSKITAEFRDKINLLMQKEKDYLKKTANLNLERRKPLVGGRADGGELDKLKDGYVKLQIELNRNRDAMCQMESDCASQLDQLKSEQASEESKLREELRRLLAKDHECSEQAASFGKRQSDLEKELEGKQQQLEELRAKFKEQMQLMEEEHHAIEAELKWKLKDMEMNTAATTKALMEERAQLEKDLQTNLDDLKAKEELYKARITELESNVTHLHRELHRITDDLDSDFASRGCSFPDFQRERLLKQLQEIQQREGEMRDKLEEMEQKEAAYRETLENADRIVASVERGYKNKIEELELSEKTLKQRVRHLEEVESRLRMALNRERKSSDGRKPNDLVKELAEAEMRESTLKEKIADLESSHRGSQQRIRELEKVQGKLEAELSEKEDLVTSLEKIHQEQETLRKEMFHVHKSESSLQLALQEAEVLLVQREGDLKEGLAEKAQLEETIAQLRRQVHEMEQQLECAAPEEGERMSETAVATSTGDKGAEDEDCCHEKRNRELEEALAELRSEVDRLRISLTTPSSLLEEFHGGQVRKEGRDDFLAFERGTVMEEEQKEEEETEGSERLREAEERAKRLCEEKKLMQEEMEKLKEVASEAERTTKEKRLLEKRLSQVEEASCYWEGLQQINARLQEQVALLQERLGLDSSAEAGDIAEKSASKLEMVLHHPSSLCEATQTEISSALPPSEDDSAGLNARLQLEECMMRAMVAMQMDLQQKKTSDNKCSSPVKVITPCGNNPFEAKQEEEDHLLPSNESRFQESDSSCSIPRPLNFRVVQQVGSDTLLVGWEYPYSASVEGFEIFVDDQLYETVYTPDRTKAVLSGLDLTIPLTISVCAISSSGQASDPEVLQLSQSRGSCASSIFLDSDDEDAFEDFYLDDLTDKQQRPYSMEW